MLYSDWKKKNFTVIAKIKTLHFLQKLKPTVNEKKNFTVNEKILTLHFLQKLIPYSNWKKIKTLQWLQKMKTL